MKDTVIKGTGNSRTIKSVPNIAALAPTYEKLLEYLTGEGLPVDIGPLNPAGVDVQGTALTKATLLTDETATSFGIGLDAVPDDALKRCAKISYGSYVGTGKGGTPNSPAKIFVGFHPRLFFVYRVSGNLNYYEMTDPNMEAFGMFIDSPEIHTFLSKDYVGATTTYTLDVKFLDDGVSFAESSSRYSARTYQAVNTTYRFIAIG